MIETVYDFAEFVAEYQDRETYAFEWVNRGMVGTLRGMSDSEFFAVINEMWREHTSGAVDRAARDNFTPTATTSGDDQ